MPKKTTPDVDMSVFLPPPGSVPPERQEESPERKEAKLSLKAAWAKLRELGKQATTVPNRQTWGCVSCHREWKSGETFYLLFSPDSLFYTAKCPECHAKWTSDPVRVQLPGTTRVAVKVEGE